MHGWRSIAGTVAVACTMCIMATARFGSDTDSNQGGLRVYDVTAAHGIVDNKPDRPASLFTPDDNPIVVWYRAEGCGVGTVITSVWFHVDAQNVRHRISEGSVTVEVVDDWGQFNYQLAPGKRWPIGAYRVELRVGDATVGDVTFRVAEDVISGPNRGQASRATDPDRTLFSSDVPSQLGAQIHQASPVRFGVAIVDETTIVRMWR